MLFILFAGFSFAWNEAYTPPSCLQQYSILGVNFTYSTNNALIPCDASTTLVNITGQTNASIAGNGIPIFAAGTQPLKTTVTAAGTSLRNYGNLNITLANVTGSFTMNVTGTANSPAINWARFNCSVGSATSQLTIWFNQTAVGSNNTSTVLTFTRLNSSAWNITSNATTSSVLLDNNLKIYADAYTGASAAASASCTFNITYLNVSNSTFTNISTGIYEGFSSPYMLWSDFKVARSNAVVTNYCRALLYFNNPYYGNIQLIPKISYIPNTDAFAYFINSSDNSAYLPNNTISYVFDSVTSVWYIVPATICTNSTVISLSTLQYNPTATTGAAGGEVPIDVTSISGSCTYNSGTRLVSCTGADSSLTLTLLTLSAYRLGNTTELCGQTTASASGTLQCTLPAVNGTYNVYFYGTDANLFNHQLSYTSVAINSSTTSYGRDAYIAGLILFGICAMVLTSNIAVSMALGCFGLFAGLAFGIIPISNAPVVILFTVIAFVIAYRLKV